MYLTKLSLDLGSAQVRRDVSNPYEMHRTLSRVFADDAVTAPHLFLWRAESLATLQDGAVLLVQSDRAGKWDVLRQMPGYLRDLHADRQLDLARYLVAGAHYHFRLVANPTVTRAGKRHGLFDETAQLSWLERQLHKGGCECISALRSRSERLVAAKSGGRITVQVARFDGVLCVRDAALARAMVDGGIGHAKALGLGMLSLLPVAA